MELSDSREIIDKEAGIDCGVYRETPSVVQAGAWFFGRRFNSVCKDESISGCACWRQSARIRQMNEEEHGPATTQTLTPATPAKP